MTDEQPIPRFTITVTCAPLGTSTFDLRWYTDADAEVAVHLSALVSQLLQNPGRVINDIAEEAQPAGEE